jgi:hypothetical protein
MKKHRIIQGLLGIGMVVLVASAPLWCNGCAGCQQTLSHVKSQFTGLNRKITLYAVDGTVIREWEGEFQVETEGGAARFIDDGKAVYIAGTFTIVEQ